MSHTKKIPQLSRSHIITRKTSSFARTSPGPRSIVRPRDRDQAETASRRERKKERKSFRSSTFRRHHLSRKNTPRKRETFSPPPPPRVQFPSRITDIKGRQNTSEYIKNKYYYGRRRRLRRQSRTYQSQLHLSVEKEKAEPREEGEERVRDHLSLSLSLKTVGVCVELPILMQSISPSLPFKSLRVLDLPFRVFV